MQMLCKYGVFLFMPWGNAYAQIIRNGKGEVVALYLLMPNKMADAGIFAGNFEKEETTTSE